MNLTRLPLRSILFAMSTGSLLQYYNLMELSTWWNSNKQSDVTKQLLLLALRHNVLGGRICDLWPHCTHCVSLYLLLWYNFHLLCVYLRGKPYTISAWVVIFAVLFVTTYGYHFQYGCVLTVTYMTSQVTCFPTLMLARNCNIKYYIILHLPK